MRRLIPSLSLLLVAFVFLISERTEAQYVSNSVFTETSFDYKGIPRYTTPRHSFVFQNNAQEDLRLVGVRTSCQCTQVFIPEKRVYKPGEKGEVVAQIDAVRFTGSRHATVTVTFERGGRVFEEPLNVVGVVLENVRVEPNKLNFVVDEIKPNEQSAPESLKRQIRSQQAQVLYPGNESVVRAICANPYVDVKIGQAVRVNGGTQTPLVVSIKENAPGGYINAVVQLWSNGANSSSPLTLNISGSVRAQLSASPSTLTFYRAEGGKKLVKNVVVCASSAFTLKRVYCDSSAIECNISPQTIRPAKICVIPITFDPAKLKNSASIAKVSIETTDGRVLILDAQISSANFEAQGLVQTDLLVRQEELEEDGGNALEKLAQNVKTGANAIAVPEQVAPINVQNAPTINRTTNGYARQIPQGSRYQPSRPRSPLPFGIF